MAISLEPGARPQAAATPASPSATETRLRLIIETAPVSLTVTTPDGTILAANARALRLFQVDRLESLVGTKFDRLIAADDRARVVAAVESVCKGADAHLTYHVANGASAGRSVEMRAVPLRRDGSTPAVCLGATWEVAEQPAQEQPATKAQVSPALEQALEEAKTALASMTRTREAERLAVGDALLQTRQRMQAALADAEERHTQSAAQWAAEKETLEAELAKVRQDAGASGSTLATLNDELAQARNAAGAATSRVESLQAELAQARDAAQKTASHLQARETELAHAREAAQKSASHLQARETELAQAHDAARQTASHLQTRETELAQARDAARQTALQLQARENELAQARDAAAAAAQASAAALTKLQGELAQARDAANAASTQLTAVSADLSQTREAAMMTAAQLAASNEQRLRAEEALEASRYRISELEAISREQEERCAQLVADRQADRVEFHEMVRTEQSKYEALASYHAQRESALADIARLLQDATVRTGQLLADKPANAAAAPVAHVAPAAPAVKAAEPIKVDTPSAAPADAPAEEDPWQF